MHFCSIFAGSPSLSQSPSASGSPSAEASGVLETSHCNIIHECKLQTKTICHIDKTHHIYTVLNLMFRTFFFWHFKANKGTWTILERDHIGNMIYLFFVLVALFWKVLLNFLMPEVNMLILAFYNVLFHDYPKVVVSFRIVFGLQWQEKDRVHFEGS
jgi:hypothetical protein